MSVLLEVKDLTLLRRGTSILNNISFRAYPGRVLGIVGASGSGKTLTALSLMGLIPPGFTRSGKIHLDGKALESFTDKQMCAVRGKNMSIVFQEPMTALNPLQNIGQQVSEVVMIHSGLPRQEALAVARSTLNVVGLPEEQFGLNRYPHELSGGQRQRVVIALAIVLQPQLLIADEPTTALDVMTQHQLLKLLRELVDRQKMGLVLISHNMAIIEHMADDIMVLDEGRVIDFGEAKTILRHSDHPHTRALIQSTRYCVQRKPHRGGVPKAVASVHQIVRDYPVSSSWIWSKKSHFRAIDHVSFSIPQGSHVGLIGESGCGKSTLMRAISAIEPIQSGEVHLNGDIFSVPGARTPRKHMRRHVQMVFQDPYSSFNPRKPVEKLIAEPLNLISPALSAAETTKRVMSILEQVGLRSSDGKKYIHSFSGGQRQRIALARALIVNPSLIILDEAFSALDVLVKSKIFDLLMDLSERMHISCFFVSHDLAMIHAVTDYVMVMAAGRITEQGRTDEVFSNPQDTYTKKLLAAAPRLTIV